MTSFNFLPHHQLEPSSAQAAHYLLLNKSIPMVEVITPNSELRSRLDLACVQDVGITGLLLFLDNTIRQCIKLAYQLRP
ncbi:MAG: hypothetical protein ACLT3W_06665 [Bifidobacterium pseudocatenulatum]